MKAVSGNIVCVYMNQQDRIIVYVHDVSWIDFCHIFDTHIRIVKHFLQLFVMQPPCLSIGSKNEQHGFPLIAAAKFFQSVEASNYYCVIYGIKYSYSCSFGWNENGILPCVCLNIFSLLFLLCLMCWILKLVFSSVVTETFIYLYTSFSNRNPFHCKQWRI